MNDLVTHIAGDIGMHPVQIRKIIRSAPHRYKVFDIPKKNGDTRQIAQPTKATKYLQRWLVENLKSDLPVHPAATAYQVGSSIAKNAQMHVRNRYLLKMDFSNFFNSITIADVSRHLANHTASRFSGEDLELIGRLLCWAKTDGGGLVLSIGAPSSPFISNSIMFAFDEEITKICEAQNVTYTRYADDLAFSCNQPGVLNGIEAAVAKVVTELEYPSLRINSDKTVHTSKKHHRKVTGIVLNSVGEISLGRERKRQIRAMAYRYTKGELDEDQTKQLRGLISFANDVEPDFVTRLDAKFNLASFGLIKGAED